jgi:quinolinate synthase
MVGRLRREIPGKTFLPAKEYSECASMKSITLENTYASLLNEAPVIHVPEEVAVRARVPIERMLEMSR